MTKVPGSAEVQEILAKYREGTMSLDEAVERIYDIAHPPQPWWMRWKETLIIWVALLFLGFWLGFWLAVAYRVIWGS